MRGQRQLFLELGLHIFSPRPGLKLEAAHVLHQTLLEVTGVVYYILNDYTNLRQIRLKLQPTG